MLSMKKKPQVFAQLSSHVLTVAFQSSEPPLLWHYDLEKNHSFTLSLHRQEGEWELGVTVAGGSFQPVAHFDDYDVAEGALKTIQEALMTEKKTRCKGASASLKGLLALLAFASLVGGAWMIGHAKPAIKMTTVTERVVPPSKATTPVGQEGVPVAADDVLDGPSQ